MERIYSNRELSTLDFQERVLSLAENPNLPLLERVKFVAITSSNLDEFHQVRVAGLREQKAAGVVAGGPDGMTPSEQLDAIRHRCTGLLERIERVFHKELLPALKEAGIRIASWDEIDATARKSLGEVFEQEIYPVLTPLAFDPSHPFPYISNLSLNLAASVRNPKTGEGQFARIKVPPLLPRFLEAGDGSTFVPVDDVIAAHAEMLFPRMEVAGLHPFRVTRSAEQAIEEDEADDLLAAMEELLHTRNRFSRVVRLEVDAAMPEAVVSLLADQMGLDPSAIYVQDGLLALAGLMQLTTLDRPDLMNEPWVPTTQAGLADREDRTIFGAVRERDILVHMPYESFATSTGAFLAAASRDPNVVAIKQTLYRTSDPDDPAAGGESSIVRSLRAAARSGKQVVVLVELRARFDEEANIAWARLLEEAGVHVVYGVTGLKTHAKIALVVRREASGLRRYSHIGTGNYNPKTARIYEDLALLTASDEIGADLSELFNVLTGYSRQRKYRKLAVAPIALRRRFVKRVRRQAEMGPEGRIVWKFNHLVDPDIIDELYRASQAGVEIDLVVRGICCLRPGVPGLSETIRVRSILGRYLEHSRIYRFGRGEDAEYFLGSADMMPRNLNGRVEAMVVIEDAVLRERLEEILQVALSDDQLAWELGPDERWRKVPTVTGLNAQLRLQGLAVARAAGGRPDADSAADATDVVIAAGGIVTRDQGRGPEILLVHRPRYDDWSFPKGKLDGDESQLAAALREVSEETGFVCSPGPDLGIIEYTDHAGSRKVVRYWAMTVDSGTFVANEEVDDIAWESYDRALERLSYERDRAMLRTAFDP